MLQAGKTILKMTVTPSKLFKIEEIILVYNIMKFKSPVECEKLYPACDVILFTYQINWNIF
jgi:hypothetical protein